jgi:hypothetical protein
MAISGYCEMLCGTIKSPRRTSGGMSEKAALEGADDANKIMKLPLES